MKTLGWWAVLCMGWVWVGCEKNQDAYVPQWLTGFHETWFLHVELRAALPNQASQSWSTQSLLLHLKVDSVTSSQQAWFHLNLDSLQLTSRARDSLENAFITERLTSYSARFLLNKSGVIENWSEEPVWPHLGSAWVSPQALLNWVLPTWQADQTPSDRQARTSASTSTTTLHSLDKAAAETKCQWDREENPLPKGADTSLYRSEWSFKPHFEGLLEGCPELPWRGLAQFQGQRSGLGLKEFKWQAQAQYDAPQNPVDSGENSPNPTLQLTREILLVRR